MSIRRYGLFSLAAAAMITIASAARAFTEAITRVALFLLDALAQPFDYRLALEGWGGDMAPTSYEVGPSLHSLRHEAGTSRRSAARHT